jgi:hypothetical protein
MAKEMSGTDEFWELKKSHLGLSMAMLRMRLHFIFFDIGDGICPVGTVLGAGRQGAGDNCGKESDHHGSTACLGPSGML